MKSGSTLFVSIAVVIIGLVAISPAHAASASNWNIQTGAGSKDLARWGLAFYPNEIAVHSGDSVTFSNELGEPHTVTFGGPDDLFVNFVPFFAPSGGNTLTGSPGELVNSGLLGEGFPFGTSFTVTIAAPPGTYPYRCMLHPLMRGSITVVPQDESISTSAKQTAHQAHVEMQQDLATGHRIIAQAKVAARRASDIGGSGIEVVAGDGDGTTAIFRFFSSDVTIHTGQSITFVNRDFYTPHTVTFGAEPPGAPESLADPYGDAAHFNGTARLNSGFLYTPFNRISFTITFTTPGHFQYFCALHDDLGMVGSVTVRP